MAAYRNRRQSDSLSPLYSPDTTGDIVPKLEIIEQPCDSLRFRYLSELSGTPHGPLLAHSSTKNRKVFPTVKLFNFYGEAEIMCWLVDNTDHPTPHVHRLVIRKNKNIIDEPHSLTVNRDNDFTVSFENLVILHAVQKDSEKDYNKKIKKWASRHLDCCDYPEDINGKNLKEIFKSVDKNVVHLYFEALEICGNSRKFLCSAVSSPIKNLKNPESGELKICRQSHKSGTANGGDEVFIFVSKLPKGVRIEFFDKKTSWVDYGQFGPSDVHAKYAIAFRTPCYPYHIDEDTEVFFKLVRETDEVCSNSCSFIYKPSITSIGKKRKILDPYSCQNILDEKCWVTPQSQKVIVQPAIADHMDLEEALDNLPSGPSMSSGELSDINNFLYDGTGEILLDADEIEEDGPITLRGPIYHESAISIPMLSLPLQSYYEYIRSGFHEVKRTISSHIKDFSNGIRYSSLTNDQTMSMLFYSTRHGHNNRFKRIFNNCCNNKQFLSILQLPSNDSKYNIIQEAILFQREKIVSLLLEKKCCNLLETDEHKNTLFHLAAERDSRKILSLIPLSQTSNISILNYDGMNCLHVAVQHHQTENVAYLVRHLDVDAPESKAGNSPLHLAVNYKFLDIIKILIEAGANVNSLNMAGNTPLHLAVMNRDSKIVKFLLRHGADKRIPHGFLLDDNENTQFSQFLNNEGPNDLTDMMKNLTVSNGDKETVALFSTVQTEVLMEVLTKNEKWKMLAKAIDKDDDLLSTFMASHKPVEMLLDYIDLHREEIFHCTEREDCLKSLDKILSSIGLEISFT